MASRRSEEVVYDSESGSEYEEKAFEPPRHFNQIDLPNPQTAQNKEVWLIKTPKDFPISELKTLPVSFTAKTVKNDGVKPFSVHNSSYQVNEELFSSDTGKFAVVNGDLLNKKIDRFYTIREVVSIPEIDYETMVEPRKDVEKAENLKMRHFATGYAAKDFTEAQPIAEPRLDANGKVLKKARTASEAFAGEDEADAEKVKKEKKEKKDKKKKKKEKKEKKKD